MNNLVLLAKLEYSPELRHTTDGKEVSETVVSFEDKENICTLKAIAWGKTATSLHQELRQGDVVLFEGSLQMNTIERSEGFKEKIAEMVVQKFEKLSGSVKPISTPIQTPAPPIEQYLPEPDDIPF